MAFQPKALDVLGDVAHPLVETVGESVETIVTLQSAAISGRSQCAFAAWGLVQHRPHPSLSQHTRSEVLVIETTFRNPRAEYRGYLPRFSEGVLNS